MGEAAGCMNRACRMEMAGAVEVLRKMVEGLVGGGRRSVDLRKKVGGK